MIVCFLTRTLSLFFYPRARRRKRQKPQSWFRPMLNSGHVMAFACFLVCLFCFLQHVRSCHANQFLPRRFCLFQRRDWGCYQFVCVHERRFLSSIHTSLCGASSRLLPLAATAGVAEVSGPQDRTDLKLAFSVERKRRKRKQA